MLIHSIFTPLSGVRIREHRKLLNPLDLDSPPGTPLFFIYNRRAHSQAGRRGFESRLALHIFQRFT